MIEAVTQKIYTSMAAFSELIRRTSRKRYMLVCDASFPYLGIEDTLSGIGVPYIKFDGFTSNPLYEDVCKGVRLFNDEHCDAIVAIGGGSTIDVAKCIKLFCKMDEKQNYLTQEYRDSGVPLLAVPTTAGTGSEATRYAVIYYGGQKQSVTHESIIPNYAVLEPDFLKTLPVYQKKCTMLDALCQGIESWWSVNSTDESKGYAKIAIEKIFQYMDPYIFENDGRAAREILLAANYAGRAINITQTTAAHAMSYQLTKLYGLPHGHAVAVCLPEVWRYMLTHTDGCIDSRGSEYLSRTLSEIPVSADWLSKQLQRLEMSYPAAGDRGSEIELLTRSVNPVRLSNNPVALTEPVLRSMYERIVQ